MERRRVRWWQVGVALVGLGLGPSVWRWVRPQPTPVRQGTSEEPHAALEGISNWKDPLGAVGGGALNVRVMDLATANPDSTLLGSAEIFVPRGSKYLGWRVPVPTRAIPRIGDAVIVVAITEGGAVRSLASGPVRHFQYRPLTAAPKALDPVAVYLRPPDETQTPARRAGVSR